MATAPVLTAISNDSGVPGDFITNDATLLLSGSGANGESVAIIWYAGDRATDDRLSPYASSNPNDGTNWALVSGGTWSLDLTATHYIAYPANTASAITLSEGVNTIYLHAFDGIAFASTRQLITLDTIAPVLTLSGITIDSGLSGSDMVTNDNTIVFSGNMSEGGTLMIESQLVGFGWVTQFVAVPVSGGAGSLPASLPLLDGVRNFRFTPTDAAGNVGTAVTVTVTIDTAAPATPSLAAITTDTNTPADFITTDTTLVFTGTAEANSFVQVTRVGVGVIASGFADALGNFAVASGTLPYAEMMVTVTATDLAGNVSTPTAPQQLVVFPGNITINPATAQYNQTFNGGWGDDVINIGPPSSHNAAHGMYGDDWIGLNGYLNTITGGAGNDTISGGQGFAHIDAGTGNDWVTADGFLNTIFGGAGNDTIYGGDGYLYLDGGDGDDAIVGEGNNNTIIGGAGNDNIWAGQGNSSIDGGAGNNIIYVDGWNNQVTVGDGNNIIQDLDGQGTIIAGHGNNLIALLGWNNHLTLGNGNNHVIVAWGGNSTVTTGNGNNTIELSGWNNLVTTGNGNDNIWAGMGMSTINAGGGNDTVWLGASGASTVNLGAGHDVVYTGGAFGDTITGGLGDDQFVLVNGTTVIIENPGGGTDTVWVNFTGYTLAENVEFGRIYGNNNIALTGNALDNSLIAFGTGSMLDGQDGHDGLWGTSNADIFRGGMGNDAMYSLGGMDRYVYDAATWGNDGIAGWVAGQKLDFTGSGLAFADLAIASGGGNSLVTYGASTIMIFGAASLTAGDFIFG